MNKYVRYSLLTLAWLFAWPVMIYLWLRKRRLEREDTARVLGMMAVDEREERRRERMEEDDDEIE